MKHYDSQFAGYTFFLCKGNTMTELEIVNDILRMVGASPINSLNSPHPYVSGIRSAIDKSTKRLQRRGYWFNTEYEVECHPTNDRIILSNDISSIIPEDSNIILRGKTLFHRVRNSNVFTSPVRLRSLVRILPLENVPESMQEAILYTAGFKYITETIGDDNLIRVCEQEQARAIAQVLNEDLEAEQLNAFTRPTSVRMRVGVRPYSMFRSYRGF